MAGIACNSINKIEGSRNYGDIFAKSKTATIYAGGIVAMNAISDKSMGTINLCKAIAQLLQKMMMKEKCLLAAFVGHQTQT